MIYGIIFAVLSAIMVAISLFYQKTGLEKQKKFDIVKIWQSKSWILGTLIGIVSFAFYLLSLKMEKVSLVQPIVSSSIIFLLVIDYFFLKEKIGKSEITSVILVLAGIILISVNLMI